MAVRGFTFVLDNVAMKHKKPVIRYFYLMQWIIQRPYPEKSELLQWLEEKNISITERTLFRDLDDLKNMYNMPIAYCYLHKGYFMDDQIQGHYDTERFLQLLQELITASSLSGVFSENLKYLKHLEFEDAPSKDYQEIFTEVLDAVDRQVKIGFEYFSYIKNAPKNYTVQPVYIKKFQNRWYLIALDKEKTKSFALERMSKLKVSNRKVEVNSQEIRDSFSQVVGLSNQEDQMIQRVVLRFCPSQKNYIKSVPLHKSQTEVSDLNTGYTVELYVRPNFELRQQILKYGQLVQVLGPVSLREDIKSELMQALGLYQPGGN